MNKALRCAALALLACGCSDSGSEPSVATSVVVTPASVTLDAVGASQEVHASVLDQAGKPMPGVALSWSSSSSAVTVAGVGGDGAIVTASQPGNASITATAGAASGSAAVQVAPAAASLAKAGGDGQRAMVHSQLPLPVRVKVLDRFGSAIAGQAVTFAVTQGDGSVGSASVTTGADGIAATTWLLGTSTSSGQEVTASAGATATPVKFTATATVGPLGGMAVFAGGTVQQAPAGTAVATRPAVRVTDIYGNPMIAVTVNFLVTSGGGSVTGLEQFTADNGVAIVGSWTLGAAPGANTLTASIPGFPALSVAFSATGT